MVSLFQKLFWFFYTPYVRQNYPKSFFWIFWYSRSRKRFWDMWKVCFYNTKLSEWPKLSVFGLRKFFSVYVFFGPWFSAFDFLGKILGIRKLVFSKNLKDSYRGIFVHIITILFRLYILYVPVSKNLDFTFRSKKQNDFRTGNSISFVLKSMSLFLLANR